MKRVGKFILFVFTFNLLAFSTATANAGVTGSANNTSNVSLAQESMTLDQYKTAKEYPTSLTESFSAYTGLASASTGEQLIIAAIKSGLENLQTTINLDKYIQYFQYRSDAQLPLEYYFDALYEYPEIFYPNLSVKCSYYYDSSTSKITSYSLSVSYSYDNSTISAMKTKFSNKLQSIKSNYISVATTSLEKEYAIHDYIIQNTTYDYDNYSSNTIPNIDHTAYGSLVNGLAVCDGYSKGAQILLRDSGIESGIVESESMNHAWNFVKLDGYYYFLDLTWDDPDSGSDYIDYTYFNATSSEMKTSHTWDEAGYPASTSTKFSFLRNGDLYERSGSKLYYSDYVNKTYYLYSMDLQGLSNALISNKSISRFEVYKNNVYRISYSYSSSGSTNYSINRLNLTSKDERSVFTTSGSIQDMYKVGSNLIVEYTESGVNKTKTISIAFVEDVNADGQITITDLATIANAYNAKSGSTKYNSSYDLNSDSIIDIYDITRVASEL